MAVPMNQVMTHQESGLFRNVAIHPVAAFER
jgi:hypothetical protein